MGYRRTSQPSRLTLDDSARNLESENPSGRSIPGYGWVYMPSDWPEYDRTLGAMRECLGNPATVQAWAEGAAMT